VAVETFHEASRLYAGIPSTTHSAQYALAFPVSAALVHGKVGPEEITGSGLSDPRVGSLTEQVKVHENEQFSRQFPHRRLARITLHLTDGRSISSRDTEPLGTPGNPMDGTAIRTKFRQYATPEMGADRTTVIESKMLDLARPASRLSDLLAVIGGP